MVGGKSSEKSSKSDKKDKIEEKIEFHDCESDSELIKAESEHQHDLSLIAHSLEDPTAFHKELQEIVSTTQQLLVKFDSKYKPSSQRYRKKSQRKTVNISDSDRSVRSSKSVLLEIHFQLPMPPTANNIMYHQVSTLNENTFQVVPPQTPLEKLGYTSQQLDKSSFQTLEQPVVCDQQPKPNCIAGDNKHNLKTESQTNISEKTIYLTPKTSASCFSILSSSQIDIQLLHSNSKLLTLQTRKKTKSSQSVQKSKPSKTSQNSLEPKEQNSEVDFQSSASMLDRAGNSIRGAGTSILFQGKRFMSSISSYMGGYVVEEERNTNETCKISRKQRLPPKVSRTRQRRRNFKRKHKATSCSDHQSVPHLNEFSTMPQFSFPPEFAAMAANGQTMPAIVMFMPPSPDPSNSQQQNPISLQALCIPFMNAAHKIQTNLPSSNSKLSSECASCTEEPTVCSTSASNLQQQDIYSEPSQSSCTTLNTDKTLMTTNSDFTCSCPNELEDQCIIVTQLNEPIEDELECHCCESDATLIASESLADMLPAELEPEPEPETCCARNKGETCVECVNITAAERELKPLTNQYNKYKKPCSCGLKYSTTPSVQVPCTCNADGHLNEDCKLPACVEKYGVCPCDCSTKESIVKCCNEAFETTCICADYNIPKIYRKALPQHKDLNLCIKCRFDPSPLIDAEGKAFCPGDCGCCLCPWQPRATLSKDRLMLHEKVRVCVCRDRGTIFNLSPKNSKCTNPGNFDLCPCRERAEAKFLELYEKEMFKINHRELNELSGPPVTLKDVREVIPLKEKQRLPLKKKK